MDYAEAKQIFLELADKHEVDWMHAEEHGFKGRYEGQEVETLYDDIKMLGPQLGTPDWYVTYAKDEELPALPDECVAVLIFQEAGYVEFIKNDLTSTEFKELLSTEVFQSIRD